MTSNQFIKRSKKKTRKNSVLFLTVLLLTTACQSTPKKVDTRFDGHWQFIDPGVGQAPLSCLEEDDVMNLKILLDKCGMGEQ